MNVTDIQWHQINWKAVEGDVNNLRQRIFVASRNNDLKKVSSLQKLMLRSKANWLSCIRRVTQINKGRRTPGVDREVITKPKDRMALMEWLSSFTLNDWNPPPTKRIEIPKGNGKTRPLGIPTVKDRIIQAIVKNALEPYWEAKFEYTSYGFRPGRSTHDAIQDVKSSLQEQKRLWILDADVKGAFDNIDHDKLMEIIGNFPARFLIRKWLKAGVMIGLNLTPTISGTPQGGVISPLLANIALHGLEEVIGMKWKSRGRGYYTPTRRSRDKVVRYADDFVVMCDTKEAAEAARTKIAAWLKDRGLEMSDSKTSIVHIEEGFDFLGFNVKKEKNSRVRKGSSVFVRPSKKNIAIFKGKVKTIFKGIHHRPDRIMPKLNPLIRGWGMYYRYCSPVKVTFSKMDKYIWERSWKYTARRHPKKGTGWRKKRYYRRFLNRDWTFFGTKENGDRLYVLRMGHISVKTYIRVPFHICKDDPEHSEYWAKRAKIPKGVAGQKTELWRRQKGLCTHCNAELDNGEELHKHHKNRDRKDNRMSNLELLHETCHTQITLAQNA